MTCTGLHKPSHGQQRLAACAEALPDGALAALDDDLVDELACQRFETTADEAAA